MSPLGRCASLVAVVALVACGSRPPIDDPSTDDDPPDDDQPAAVPRATAPPIDAAPPAPPPPVVLTDAVRIEITDAWSGLGCSHTFHATLTANATHDAWRGEATLKTHWPDSVDRREVTLTRDTIVRLEGAVDEARAAMARAAAASLDAHFPWTDDSPSGGLHFIGAEQSYRIAFTDQRRQLMLEHDGTSEPLEPPDPNAPGTSLTAAYRNVLSEIGMIARFQKACSKYREPAVTRIPH